MRRLAATLTIVFLITVGACGSSASTRGPARSPSAPAHISSRSAFTDWPTYHRTNGRSGRVRSAVRTPLRRSWQDRLRGAVYGEPLVVGRTLIVATEQNYVFGLRARTGKHLWRVRLGRPAKLSSLPCGDIDPQGITGTPAYDASTGSVFVVAQTHSGHHTLWALNAGTGRKRWHRSLDTQPKRDFLAEQERSALLVTGGRVITTFGGRAGDCGNYVGYVTSVAVSGHGRIHSYAVPTAREAGMWSPAGPVTGENGNVYLSSGNGAELHGKWDKSDSVTELTPTRLKRRAVFAPRTWRQDNTQDLDLGSSSPLVVRAVHRLVIAGKRGTVYLLKPGLGGVGSDIDQIDGCKAFGGAAVVGRTVLMPCRTNNSIRALRVRANSLHWSWTASNLYASPVIAGTLVYVADADSGDLVVLKLSTGAVKQRLHAGEMTHFPSEVVDGGMVFVPTLTGISAFTGS